MNNPTQINKERLAMRIRWVIAITCLIVAILIKVI